MGRFGLRWPAGLNSLRHSRLVQAFVGVAVVHAIVLGLLQGAALQSCARGVKELNAVRGAAEGDQFGVSSEATSLASAGPSSVNFASIRSIRPITTASPQLQTSSPTPPPNSLPDRFDTSPRPAPTNRPTRARTTDNPARPTSPQPNSPRPSPTTTDRSEDDQSEGDESDDGIGKGSTNDSRRTRRQRHRRGSHRKGMIAKPLNRQLSSRFARVTRGGGKVHNEVVDSTVAQDESNAVPEVDTTGTTIRISTECSDALGKPIKALNHMQTTAATFIFYQLWMLGLSLSGVVAESVPHLATVALAHALASAFAIYQAVFTAEMHRQFRREVVRGACSGMADLPRLSDNMLSLEQAVAVLEAVGLIVLAAIGWHLSSVLTFRQFTTIGASPLARRKRFLVLGTELALQIALFFLAAFQVIWLREIVKDHLNSDPMRRHGGAGVGYEVMLGVITGLVPAWGLCGWVALRREGSWLVGPFLLGSGGLIAHTAWLETRPVYTAQASDWGFLNFLGIAGATIVLGLWLVYCWLRLPPEAYPADLSQPFPAHAGTPEKDSTNLVRSTSQSSQASQTTQGTFSSFDTSLSSLTEDSNQDPFESFGYHSRSSTVDVAHPSRPTISNLPSPFSSSDGSDPSPVARSPRARKAPPPALTLTQAVNLRKEKLKIVPVSVEVDGRSIKDESEELDEPPSVADSSSFEGASPAEVGFARVGERVAPARKPSLTKVRAMPPVAVGQTEQVPRVPKTPAPAKVSLRSLWRAGAGALPANPRAGLPVAHRQRGSLRSVGGERAVLGSRWSDSTSKTKGSV